MARWALLLALALGACTGRESASNPEGAVRLLIAATKSGDRAAVHARLGPITRGRIETLQTNARRTSGRIVLKPEDYLSVGWAPPVWEPAGVRTLERTGDRALVEVYSASGDRHTVTVVRENGEWKVELPGGG